MALAMSLFGGVPKNVNDKHRIRGDCNVLLLDLGLVTELVLVLKCIMNVVIFSSSFSLLSVLGGLANLLPH